MKLDQLIGYFNTKKINLIPPFQRGHVWNISDRRALLENMVARRPIPAIFLYKEADGSQFAYNILDGKQRLESLILFIGTKRPDLKVDRVKDYFFDRKEKRNSDFLINWEGKKTPFRNLPENVVRHFREYAIPTIEIELDDDSSLDEVINLFVDINQQGARVKRFDIVKAIGGENPLLLNVLSLVAIRQTRAGDKFFKKKNNQYTRVLGRLQVVQNAADKNQAVDRMWERLVEIALFNRTNAHRQPGQVLKAFIKTDKNAESTKMTQEEKKRLSRAFSFLDKAYEETGLGDSRLATDLPFFYTMVTSLLRAGLLEADGAPPDYLNVRSKLRKFAKMLPDNAVVANDAIGHALTEYKQTAERQTTHPGRRATRQEKFLEILLAL